MGGFPTFKGKLQSIREDIDYFEKKVMRGLEEIKCVLEVIIPYDSTQQDIVDTSPLHSSRNKSREGSVAESEGESSQLPRHSGD